LNPTTERALLVADIMTESAYRRESDLAFLVPAYMQRIRQCEQVDALRYLISGNSNLPIHVKT
jgi:hypothetical protein